MKRTWKENASEFAKLDRGEGWPFALLVACSVEKGKGHGGDRKSDNRDNSRNLDLRSKTDATSFAEQAGTSAPRVLRFLDAWHKAADEGHARKAWKRAVKKTSPETIIAAAEEYRAWR